MDSGAALRYLPVIVVCAVIVLVGVSVTIFLVRRRRREIDTFSTWAQLNGWDYTARDDSLATTWDEYPVKGYGKVTNILRAYAPEGKLLGFILANAVLRVDSEVSKERLVRFVTALDTSAAGGGHAVPTLFVDRAQPIRPEWLGPPDSERQYPHTVEFDAPAFTAAWRVGTYSAADSEVARRMLTPEVRRRLLRAVDHFSQFTLTFEGTWILLTEPWDMVAGRDGPHPTERLSFNTTLLRDIARLLPQRG